MAGARQVVGTQPDTSVIKTQHVLQKVKQSTGEALQALAFQIKKLEHHCWK